MSRNRRLLLESLEQRQLLSVSLGASGKTSAAAVLVSLNSAGIGSDSGKLVKVGEMDAYTFKSAVTGPVVIREVTNTSSVFPTSLTVYDASGKPITPLSYPDPAQPYVGLVAISATKGSAYYATAAAAPNSGCIGAYSIQITPGGGCPTFAQAASITLYPANAVGVAGSASQSGKIDYPSDADFYSFKATVTGNLTVRQTAVSSSVNSDLTVYDANQNVLAANGAPGSINASVTLHVTAGNSYYAEAAAFASSTGAYVLQFSTLADPPVVKPPPPVGHTFATATPISITPDPSNHGIVTTITYAPGTDYAIGSPSDVDYFTFVAPTTGQMTIHQNADASEGSALVSHLYVYDVNENLIQQNAGSANTSSGLSPNSRVSISVVAGMKYYAEAAGYASSTGAYQLTFLTVATTPDTPGTFANATPITIAADGTSETAGTIDFLGDDDFYSFVAPETGSLAFRMTAMSGGLQTHTYIYSSSRMLLADGSVDVQAILTGNDTYYVEAAGNGQTAGSYVLQSFYPPFLGMQDQGLITLVKQLVARDGGINREDMIQILAYTVSTGSLSPMDFSDLQAIVRSAYTLNMPNYVTVLAHDVVDGSPANQFYTGGALGATQLGNLQSGSSQEQMDALIGKWFLGTDMPAAEFQDDGNGELEYVPYNYVPVNGVLYGPVNGTPTPVLDDAQQGTLGDCYFLSSLVSIANANPTAVKDMILPNGDGTYTVRFYNNGVPDYVTVNNELPVLSQAEGTFPAGTVLFDGMWTITDTTSASNVLWLPLLEKAYAQWNEVGNEGHGYDDEGTFVDGINAYWAVAGGWMQPVYDQVLGAGDDSQAYTLPGLNEVASLPIVSQSIVQQALANNMVVGVGTIGTDDSLLYGGHAYSLCYDATTGLYELHNPWGNAPPVTGSAAVQPPEMTWAALWTELTSECDYLSIGNASSPQAFLSSIAQPVSTAATTAATTSHTVGLHKLYAPSSGAGASGPASSAASAWLVLDSAEANWNKTPPQPATQDLALLAYLA